MKECIRRERVEGMRDTQLSRGEGAPQQARSDLSLQPTWNIMPLGDMLCVEKALYRRAEQTTRKALYTKNCYALP